MSANISPRDLQTLSAYLDGQLSAREKTQLEARLQNSAELRDELNGLRQTRLMLRSLPTRRAPRNFTLSPANASRPARLVFPAFGFASALAGLVLVAAFIGQALLPVNLAAAPMNAPAAVAEKALAPAAVDQASREPVIITWGMPFVGGMGGGGGEEPVGGGYGGMPAAPTAVPANGMEVDTATPPARYMQPGTPTPAAVAQAEPTATPVEPAPAQVEDAGASNPILGVQKAQAYESPTPVSTLPAVGQPEQNQQALLSPWQTVQILAAVLFILTGLAAIYYYRKERR